MPDVQPLNGEMTWTAPSVREHVEALIRDLQGQLDRRIETQLRERADSLKAIEDRIAAVDRVQTTETAALAQRLEDELGALLKIIEEKEERQEALHAAHQQAVDKYEAQVEKRLEILNGIRQALSDQNSTFISREVYDNGIDQARRERDQLREDIRASLAREEFYKTVEEWTEWRRGVEQRFASQSGVEAHIIRAQDRRAITIGQAIALVIGITTIIVAIVAIGVGAWT